MCIFGFGVEEFKEVKGSVVEYEIIVKKGLIWNVNYVTITLSIYNIIIPFNDLQGLIKLAILACPNEMVYKSWI